MDLWALNIQLLQLNIELLLMTYKATVLLELAKHGIKPDDEATPKLIHDYLNDLYRYEIRRLKARMIAGLIPKSDYAAHVTMLRERYPLLSLPIRFWTESD